MVVKVKCHSRKALSRHYDRCYLKGIENLQPRLIYFINETTKNDSLLLNWGSGLFPQRRTK